MGIDIKDNYKISKLFLHKKINNQVQIIDNNNVFQKTATANTYK